MDGQERVLLKGHIIGSKKMGTELPKEEIEGLIQAFAIQYGLEPFCWIDGDTVSDFNPKNINFDKMGDYPAYYLKNKENPWVVAFHPFNYEGTNFLIADLQKELPANDFQQFKVIGTDEDVVICTSVKHKYNVSIPNHLLKDIGFDEGNTFFWNFGTNKFSLLALHDVEFPVSEEQDKLFLEFEKSLEGKGVVLPQKTEIFQKIR